VTGCGPEVGSQRSELSRSLGRRPRPVVVEPSFVNPDCISITQRHRNLSCLAGRKRNTSRTPMITNRSSTLNLSRLRFVLSVLFFAAASVVALAGIASSGSAQRDLLGRGIGPWQLGLALSENFDGVTPPVLPLGWSSITWVTSNSGVPGHRPILRRVRRSSMIQPRLLTSDSTR
jgi:hypothetical protein